MLTRRTHNKDSYGPTSDCSAVSFSLSPENAGDGPEGRKLLNFTAVNSAHRYLIVDWAYESNETRALAIVLGYIPDDGLSDTSALTSKTFMMVEGVYGVLDYEIITHIN